MDNSNIGLQPEDTVTYTIYPNWKTDASTLEQLAVECNHFAGKICTGYVWHYAPFHIRPPLLRSAAASDLQWPYLEGLTCFRENVEDEWLLVCVLLALTEEHTDFVASVQDDDGQFLLVEAANTLEKWMDPAQMENRVFLYRGRLHVIPKPRTPADIGILPVTTPTIRTAVELVRSEHVHTEASEGLQECIKRRISVFIDRPLTSQLHHAHCILPSLASYVLSRDRQLVAAACHALLDRLPADMAACRTMTHFSPLKYNMVKGGVYFTKFLYAQIMQLKFSAPRKVGFSVGSKVGSELLEHDLGIKLTCGLEILLARVRHVSQSSPNSDPNWISFLDRLKQWGYFQDHVEGSQAYRDRLATATEYFSYCGHGGTDSRGEGKSTVAEDRDPLVHAGLKIAGIVKEGKFSEEEEKERVKNISPADDDSWMNISEGDLDNLLRNKWGPEASSSKATSSTSSASSEHYHKTSHGGDVTKLQSAVFGMNSFVDKVSALAGAEFPWEGDHPSKVSAINFDPDTFLSTLESMLASSGSCDLQDGSDDNNSDDDSDESPSITSEGCEEGVGGGGADEELEELMARMDEELLATDVGKSFERMYVGTRVKEGEGEDKDEIAPVDVDFNLVSNLLESYSSQAGRAGPATNILQSLGLRLPDKQEDNI